MSRREPDRFAPLAERLAWGKSRRKALPRVAQAEWRARPSRPDPVDVLLAASRGRVPELLPIKWGRMAASPFGFFRGAVPVMARDLASQRVSGLTVQMCGDAHVRNLGAYAAADGHLVFDINDFDETMPGPWEWDLKRLAASVVLAGREAGARKAACTEAVAALVASWRETLWQSAHMPALEVARTHVRRLFRASPVRLILEKAERASPAHALEKLTVGPKGRRRFASRPPLLTRVPAMEAKRVLGALARYRATLSDDRQLVFDAYRPVDVGWTTLEGRDYLVRQLADHKAGLEPGDLGGRALLEYALVCGEVFGKAHARTGDAGALAGYAGKSGRLDAALAAFALAYADQTERDHEGFVKAIRARRLRARRA